MYKIKEFSKISNTSMVTLRYYDEIDLFKPEYVDFYSGYRYYEDRQLNIINKINLLKKLDLTLDEIKEYLKTNNKDILISKMRGYEDKMNKIKNYLDNEETKKYKIIKSNYNKYLELNGLLNSKCAMALEIKDNNADYYYIEENSNIIDDFVIYKDIKVLTLAEEIIYNEELLKEVFKEVKKDYDEIFVIIPIERKEIYNYIISKYNTTTEIITQRNYKYNKINIKI